MKRICTVTSKPTGQAIVTMKSDETNRVKIRLQTCCATTDSTSSSIRLNSSKHAHAPADARPLKNCTVRQRKHLLWTVKSKGFLYPLPSVGHGADPGVQAVGPQVTLSHPPGGRLPLLSAKPAVTFPAAEHQRPLAGTKLYCLVPEAHRCEQLAQCCYAALAPSRIWTHDLLIASPTLYPLQTVSHTYYLRHQLSSSKPHLIRSNFTLF